jgi:hypothetical protein
MKWKPVYSSFRSCRFPVRGTAWLASLFPFVPPPQPHRISPPSNFEQFGATARFPLHAVTAFTSKFISLLVCVSHLCTAIACNSYWVRVTMPHSPDFVELHGICEYDRQNALLLLVILSPLLGDAAHCSNGLALRNLGNAQLQ